MTLARNAPDYTSQGTQIEQARATADVLAAMEAAKRWPRNLQQVREDMLTVCKTERVAKTAFWSVPRGRDTKTGSTVQLMRTIAAIFGNCSFGARQLHRDERNRHTEMQAWAWDLQSNTRIEETFIVPWIVDLKGGESRPAKSETEIRELCSAVAQRKVRVQIANVLPDWYVAEAEDTALAVVEQRDKPIEKVRADVAKLLAPLGVPLPNVLHYVGRAQWNDTLRGDLAVLRIAAETINRGEASPTELFPAPPQRVEAKAVTTPEQGARPVTEHAAPKAPDVDTPEQEDPGDAAAGPGVVELTRRTRDHVMALCSEAGLDPRRDRAKRLRLFAIIVDEGRTFESGNDLSEEEGRVVVDVLEGHRAKGDLQEWVALTLAEDADPARQAVSTSDTPDKSES